MLFNKNDRIEAERKQKQAELDVEAERIKLAYAEIEKTAAVLDLQSWLSEQHENHIRYAKENNDLIPLQRSVAYETVLLYLVDKFRK